MSKLHIVYATDKRYLFPTMVALASAVVRASRKHDLVIDVLDCGIEDSDWDVFETVVRQRLGEEFSLVRHVVDMSAYDSMKEWHTSKGIYSRLEIPQILRDVEWCVYADGDTLFTGDPFVLEGLWDCQYALMGHADVPDVTQKNWHLERNIPWDAEHRICAGFILMNLDWFRANDATQKCFEFISKYRPPFNDQDALNYVCLGKIGLLPDEWGIFTYLVRPETNGGCFHYVENRPWQLELGSRIPVNSCKKIWFDTMRKTVGLPPWKTEWSWWRYALVWIKTAFMVSIYGLLNRMPGIRGRYDGVRNALWPGKAVEKFYLEQLPIDYRTTH